MATQKEKVPDPELIAKVRRRVALEEKAYRTVVLLTDTTPPVDVLSNLLQSITPEHYADIVEERSIIKHCGYPLCSKILDNIPKQQYWISTKSKTVYDITERKKFCSNFCMSASQHVLKQISTSPLWLREGELSAKINFLTKTQEKGMPGKIVVARRASDIYREIQKLESDAPELNSGKDDGKAGESRLQSRCESSVCSSDEEEIEDERQFPEWQEDYERENKCQKKTPSVSEPGLSSAGIEVSNESSDQPQFTAKSVMDLLAKKRKGLMKTCLIDISESSPAVPDTAKISNIATKGKKLDYIPGRQNVKKPPFAGLPDPASSAPASGNLKHVLLEWRTRETVKLLSLHDNVSQVFSQLNISSAVTQTSDNSLSSDTEQRLSEQTVKKENLNSEEQHFETKVKEFYGQRPAASGDNREIILPPVHSCSQMAIRRKVVLEKLSRTLPDLISRTSMAMSAITSSMRELVHTFNLTSRNILLRHSDWSAVAFILLKILATADAELRDQLVTPPVIEYVRPLMAAVKLSDDDVNEIVSHMSRFSDDETDENNFACGNQNSKVKSNIGTDDEQLRTNTLD